MSLFPRNLYSADPSFTNLFRLLDDFDTYSREVQGSGNGNNEARQRVQAVRSFNPKFDVRETENAYELHGELAGLEKDNVSIEFTDPQTIVIRGRIERSYQAGTPPSGGAIEGGAQSSSGAITENGEKHHHESHKATVEDEAAEKAKEQGTQVAKTDRKEQQQPKSPAEKYWVSERSIGEFSRTFGFPTRVEQDGVTANLNNGILSVVVPKAKKHETRRIAIN